MQHTKPARKILVIGGSSYNENTLQKIGQALIDSNFMDEWAVIIAIHQLLRLKGEVLLQEGDDTTIKSRLSLSKTLDLKIKCITSPQVVKVETGYIYVLPCPELPIDEKYLYTSFLGSSYQLKICAETSRKAQKEFETWLLHNPFDAFNTKRRMTLHDQASGEWENLPSVLSEENKLKEQNNAKKELETTPQETVVYQDMPCIDKFMSEVATSTSQPTIAGLLLCGLFGDGAKGLKEIKKKGGHTAVQYPGECCKKELKEKANATATMPNTALEIVEPNEHDIVTLEGTPDKTTLSQWLSDLKNKII